MDITKIRNEIRRRVVAAAKIDPATQLQLQNTTFVPKKTFPFWISEHVVGGQNNAITNQRCGYDAFIIQYDFVCYAGNGVTQIETASGSVSDIISPGDNITIDGISADVMNTKISQSGNDKFSSVEFAITLHISD